jgi:hypothetical protein
VLLIPIIAANPQAFESKWVNEKKRIALGIPVWIDIAGD